MNRQEEQGKPALNRIELAKLQGYGPEILQTIDDLAEKPWKELTFEDTLRLNWAGILHQKPRDGHFLAHIKLPSGKLTANQANVIADLADAFGDHSVQITTRQACQIHGIALKNVPEVLKRLHESGLTTTEADGDAVRNITGNPLMGVDLEEYIDTTGLVQALTDLVTGNREFANLPRKFKISISGNPHDPAFARGDDLGFVPAVLEKNGEKYIGFHVYLGGGFSGKLQQLAKETDFFLLPKDVVPFVKTVLTFYRDHGERVKRFRSRFKFLLEDIGIDEFCRIVDQTGGPFLHGGKEIKEDWNYGAFYGIHPQKQKGLYYAGIHVPLNTLSTADLRSIAGISLKYGSGRLRTTTAQCLILPDLKEEDLTDFEKEDILKRFPPGPGMFSGYASACTGSDYCSFAPVETRQRLADITEKLDREFPEIGRPFRITLTGCEGCCAAPQTADIGIRGGRGLVNGKIINAFFLYVGGRLGKDARLGTLLDGKIPDDSLLPLLEEIIRFYLSDRKAGEDFTHFIGRNGINGVQNIVSRYAMPI